MKLAEPICAQGAPVRHLTDGARLRKISDY